MSANASTLASRGAPSGATGLRVVRRRTRSLIKRGPARRIAPLYIAAGIGVAAVVAAVLLMQVVLAQSAFQLSTINKKLAAAEARQEQLVADVAELESPGRIERYARNVLGMIDPTAVEYVVADVRLPGNRLGQALAAEDVPATELGTAVGVDP